VRPWVSRLDAELQPGAVMQLEYLPQPYTFREGRRPGDKELAKAQHTVRAFLVFYRAPPALLITDVQKGGAAAKAKIQRGDFFATYDGVPVRTREELRSALQAAAAAGKPTVKVTLFRNGKIIETELAPGRMGLSLRGR
jgi:S1-C subfamily serine protease